MQRQTTMQDEYEASSLHRAKLEKCVKQGCKFRAIKSGRLRLRFSDGNYWLCRSAALERDVVHFHKLHEPSRLQRDLLNRVWGNIEGADRRHLSRQDEHVRVAWQVLNARCIGCNEL